MSVRTSPKLLEEGNTLGAEAIAWADCDLVGLEEMLSKQGIHGVNGRCTHHRELADQGTQGCDPC